MLRTRSTVRSGLWIAAALCTWMSLSELAKAETTIAADLDLNIPIDADNLSTGGGFGIRLGSQLHLPLVVLNPEIGFSYATLSGDVSSPKIYRGIAGARLGIGEILRFGVLAHIGFGYLTLDLPSPAPDIDYFAFAFDAGVFLDFTLLPLLNLGVHAIFNRLSPTTEKNIHYDAVNWMQLGIHAALVF